VRMAAHMQNSGVGIDVRVARQRGLAAPKSRG